MKINWKVRFNNPHWWAQVALSIGAPVLAYFGMSYEQLTSWPIVLDLITRALQNPVVIVSALVSLYNAVVDPTTKGVSDSERAMEFIKPK
ncbi:hypothetical protein FACS1894127_5760 [Clostridia bacterium]|nr:hypothetical protein FACS1894127_5760 [Clostridia bacterium]